MKNASLNIVYCIFFVIIVPTTIFFIYNKGIVEKGHEKNNYTKILDVKTMEIIKIPFEEYVWRVTAKEVPSSYHDEAIKAQSVAVRTYALRKMDKNIPEHYGADMCTDFTHCTAFLTFEDEDIIYGKSKDKIISRYKSLTELTKNQILTYENEPILAVFHATSSGTTEKSSDVWSSQLPYLINVDSSLDKNSPNYHSITTFTLNELKNVFTKSNCNDITILSRTTGGSVKEIDVFGYIYKGTEIRKMLNLKSANFTISHNGDSYTFHVVGYGHGVGMSQNGANEYAKLGMNYLQILEKYYPNTQLKNIDQTNFLQEK